MKEKKKYNTVLVSFSPLQKRIIEQKAKEKEVKVATYVRSSMIKILRQDGEDV